MSQTQRSRREYFGDVQQSDDWGLPGDAADADVGDERRAARYPNVIYNISSDDKLTNTGPIQGLLEQRQRKLPYDF